MLSRKLQVVEEWTDYDILSWNEFTIDVINRFDSDGEVVTVNIYNKSCEEIISLIENL